MAHPETLRQRLLDVAGVADAEIDETAGSTPAGVRVRLEPGADARAVGVEVQRVLASFGIRSRVANGEVGGGSHRTPVELRGDEGVEGGSAEPKAMPAATEGGSAGLGSVAVEESSDGVAVTVTVEGAGGTSVTELAEATEDGIARAVVAAVGRLVDGRTARLVSLTVTEAGSDRLVTIVAERGDGARRAGAAIVRAGIPHAVARAAWMALTTGG